jgi:hypothetical protein
MAKKSNFSQVQKKWYKKLKDEGFKDIEYHDQSLKKETQSKNSIRDPIKRAAVEEYYYLAYHFLNDGNFETELDRIIWVYHTEGISVRNISKLLAETKVAKMAKTQVGQAIKRLEARMRKKYVAS